MLPRCAACSQGKGRIVRCQSERVESRVLGGRLEAEETLVLLPAVLLLTHRYINSHWSLVLVCGNKLSVH